MPSHPSKSRSLKRKRGREPRDNAQVETSKPSAIFEAPGKGRAYTLSLALPGSVVANAQSHELKTALAGRVARAAAVFCVDEIVVFDDGQSRKQPTIRPQHQAGANGRHDYDEGDDYTGWSDPDHFLCHLLTYLECPPNLRKRLFPMHSNLRTAGALPSLDMPHHLRADEWCEYREGVTVDSAEQSESSYGAMRNRKRPTGGGSANATVIDTGLPRHTESVAPVPPNMRVTVRLPKDPPPNGASVEAEVVTPANPREGSGFYWGYSVRQCSSLSNVFTECPFEGGYDASIGTSERGCGLEQILPASLALQHSHTNGGVTDGTPQRLPDQFSHLLIVFGGVAGLEAAAAADEALKSQGMQPGDVQQLFDAWVNVCPGQGSRTIRTEEAVWLGLGAIKPYVDNCGRSEEKVED